MELHRPYRNITEEIVFTPFDASALNELKGWISKDTPTEVKAAFGSNIYTRKGINSSFLSALLHPPDSLETISMMATIRTSYHTLLNIGYVHIKEQFEKLSKTCYINCIYLSKPFRQKDYEYHILKKLVEFSVKNLQCDSCMIWIFTHNYLFLSIARTLGFRLTKIQTAPSGVTTRYCYTVTAAKIPRKIQSNLQKNYAIELPVRSRSRPQVPNMVIPNYLQFKKNLLMINGGQKLVEGSFKRKNGMLYSPILRAEARKFASQNGNKTHEESAEKLNTEHIVKIHCTRCEDKRCRNKYASPQLYRRGENVLQQYKRGSRANSHTRNCHKLCYSEKKDYLSFLEEENKLLDGYRKDYDVNSTVEQDSGSILPNIRWKRSILGRF